MARPGRASTVIKSLSAVLSVAASQAAMAESESAQVWSILEIREMIPSEDAHIMLDVDGNASGSSGCNRFHTTITQSGNILTFGPIAAARMACPPDTDGHEQALFGLFSQPLSLSYHVLRDQIVLTGPDGTRLVLQRSE
ncbi:META domain-containing protein [Rhodobacterales bacterium HKCCSP123]|nr:META domain-containing protein [Rhodobacterales bacterium HKCCSP123]